MIHTKRTVTVGKQESIIDAPIILYRGDREVEVEFTLVGNKYTFSSGGNVIESANATHGQLVLNTPSGENMFSEVTECDNGKVVFVITKEMIDELIEVGFYSFQIRLYDSEELVSRVTIPPVQQGFDIRNPIAAEDATNVVDQALVDYSRIYKDQLDEEVPTFDWTGAYNKTEWVHHDVITENKMNKIEDALYSINANVKESDVVMLNTLDRVKKDADAYVKEHIAEVEADVEEFERNLNTGVDKFKIDTNAAMTAHKNEVSEVVDGFNTQLEYVMNAIISPLHFGAKGDGVADDTIAIQNAISYAEETGCILHGLNKAYLISDIMGVIPSSAGSFREDYGLYITKSITITNMKLVVKGGIKLYTTAINIYGGIDTTVRLENIEIDGNKALQSVTPGREEGGKHGIRIYGQREIGIGTVLLTNCNIHHCSSDCMIVRAQESVKVHCVDCVFDSAGRNGVTDNSKGLSIYEGCKFTNASNLNPQNGFHIEPDSEYNTSNYYFKNCEFTGNKNNGFKIYNGWSSLIENIKFDNCKLQNVVLGINGNANLKKFSIVDSVVVDKITFSCNSSNIENSVSSFEGYINNCKLGSIWVSNRSTVIQSQLIVENSEFGYLIGTDTNYKKIYINNCDIHANEQQTRALNMYQVGYVEDFTIKNCRVSAFGARVCDLDFSSNRVCVDSNKIESFKLDSANLTLRVIGAKQSFITNNTIYEKTGLSGAYPIVISGNDCMSNVNNNILYTVGGRKGISRGSTTNIIVNDTNNYTINYQN